uniref:Mha1 n=1 Tax=Arundo donax TaxID=35708 RepID=A0A0A9A189_ARUDO
MQPRGPHLRAGRAAPGHLRPQQAGGEAGEQVPQVPGVHVEPAVLGHGGRRHHGHRARQWGREAAGLAGLRGDHHAAYHQLHHQLHRGEQCWQCCCRSHGPPRPQGQGS